MNKMFFIINQLDVPFKEKKEKKKKNYFGSQGASVQKELRLTEEEAPQVEVIISGVSRRDICDQGG